MSLSLWSINEESQELQCTVWNIDKSKVLTTQQRMFRQLGD